MGDISLRNLRFLVADDFGNFRSTIHAMLVKLGVLNIEMVPSGEALISACEKRPFDVILSDYDLGNGRNGQRVLEELRHRQLISRKTLFVIVSGNAAREVVLASYDCEPDDYLAKPITAKLLEQRLLRLLLQRQALMPALNALEKGDRLKAVSLLTDLSMANDRNAVAAQKMLGELFLEQGDLDKAERLYTMVLNARVVDWARLGLAKIQHLRGEHDTAAVGMEHILQENPLYLPAYDALADYQQKRGKPQLEQAILQRALDVSPMSILRQKRLAVVAQSNGDIPTALAAWRNTLKLGEYSCLAQPEDALHYAKLAVNTLQKSPQRDAKLAEDVSFILAGTLAKDTVPSLQDIQVQFLRGRLSALDGKMDAAKTHFEKAETRMHQEGIRDIDLDIERVYAKQVQGQHESAERLLRELLQSYAYDQEALEKLDHLLAEPVSESNREWVASVNREGIDLYNQGQFDQALECFERARQTFPKHIGIQLNRVQALIGKKRQGENSPALDAQLAESLKTIEAHMDTEHSQYPRYKRLRQMAFANTHASMPSLS